MNFDSNNIDIDIGFFCAVRDSVDRFNRVYKDKEEPISEKIKFLKEIIDHLCLLATETMNDARLYPELVTGAIKRVHHVMDVLGDENCYEAPLLVKKGLLDNFSGAVVNLWKPLADHRDKKLGELRFSLKTMLTIESKQVEAKQSQHTAPQPPR